MEKKSKPSWRSGSGTTRREFIAQMGVASGGLIVAPSLSKSLTAVTNEPVADTSIKVELTINGASRVLNIDPRMTLLDVLREELKLTGTKKSCDRGQCGACTVLQDGRRINSCLTLAAACQHHAVTTIEGVADGEQLHPLQDAFIRHDAFQCGYCTPGQICSAIGLLKEGHAKTKNDISELMSGNICRCGAYKNIVTAIQEVGAIG